MRWSQFPSASPLIQTLLVLLIGLAASTKASASVTVRSVGNASATDGLSIEPNPSGTPAPTGTLTIYGGVSGDYSLTFDPESVADTCTYPATPGLVACNNRRIHPDLNLRIVVSSDSVDNGFPKMTFTPTGGATQDLLTTQTGTSGQTAKGADATLVVKWRDICAKMGADVDGNCNLVGTATKVTASFRVGLSVANDSSLGDSGDDSVPINVTIAGGIAAAGVNCDDPNAIGVCHFEVFPGDEKVILKNLRALNGFPTTGGTSGLGFRSVRVLRSTVGFTDIKSSSESSDLTINGTDANDFSVSPARVTGLQNDTTYYFKVAVIDLAGNVGYYNNDDDYCTYATRTTGCHQATPGEVLGVLEKDMNCFVATAAWGSPMAPQVEILRDFRDKYLKPSAWGAAFVRYYYAHSPKYAHIIAQSETLRAISRGFLWPLLAYAWLSLKLGALTASLVTLAGLAISIFAVRRLMSLWRSEGARRA